MEKKVLERHDGTNADKKEEGRDKFLEGNENRKRDME